MDIYQAETILRKYLEESALLHEDEIQTEAKEALDSLIDTIEDFMWQIKFISEE